LGKPFAGTLVSDGLPTYDAAGAHSRQLCLAHLLKRCSRLEEQKTRGAVRFPRQAARLLRQALTLRGRRGELSPRGFAVARGRLEGDLDRMLRYHLTDADNERLAAHLFQHRPHLLTFLYEQSVEPTNNLAERQLRPAVIARKLSAGNRSQRGARTHAVLASLAATCRQRGERFSTLAATLLRESPHPSHAFSAHLAA
jgi:transposase